MKIFKSLEEMRAYQNEKSKEYYHRHKNDDEYKRKRREYQKKRYAEMIAKFKDQTD